MALQQKLIDSIIVSCRNYIGIVLMALQKVIESIVLVFWEFGIVLEMYQNRVEGFCTILIFYITWSVAVLARAKEGRPGLG